MTYLRSQNEDLCEPRTLQCQIFEAVSFTMTTKANSFHELVVWPWSRHWKPLKFPDGTRWPQNLFPALQATAQRPREANTLPSAPSPVGLLGAEEMVPLGLPQTLQITCTLAVCPTKAGVWAWRAASQAERWNELGKRAWAPWVGPSSTRSLWMFQLPLGMAFTLFAARQTCTAHKFSLVQYLLLRKAWGCCFICLCLHDSSIIGAKINSTRLAAHRRSQEFPGKGFGLTLAAAVLGDKALSDRLIWPGASKGIVFFGPRGLFLPLPENWVWSVGLEWRWITDKKRTLASSLVLLDDLIDKASEVQTGQLACLPQGTGVLGPDPLATSPVQTADHILLMRWVVLVLWFAKNLLRHHLTWTSPEPWELVNGILLHFLLNTVIVLMTKLTEHRLYRSSCWKHWHPGTIVLYTGPKRMKCHKVETVPEHLVHASPFFPRNSKIQQYCKGWGLPYILCSFPRPCATASVCQALPGKCLFIPQNTNQERLPPTQFLGSYWTDYTDPFTFHELSLMSTDHGPLLPVLGPGGWLYRLVPSPSALLMGLTSGQHQWEMPGQGESEGWTSVSLTVSLWSVLTMSFIFSTQMLCSPGGLG